MDGKSRQVELRGDSSELKPCSDNLQGYRAADCQPGTDGHLQSKSQASKLSLPPDFPTAVELVQITREKVDIPREEERKQAEAKELERAKKAIAELPDKLRREAANPGHFSYTEVFKENTIHSDREFKRRVPAYQDLGPSGKLVYDTLSGVPGFKPSIRTKHDSDIDGISFVVVVDWEGEKKR